MTTPYRAPDPPPDSERIQSLEESKRVGYVFRLVGAMFIFVFAFNDCANAGRLERVEEAAGTLAVCRVLDDTELEERRRITHGQDDALCGRACVAAGYVGAFAANCTWLPAGRRSCSCSCDVRPGPADHALWPTVYSVTETR